MNDEGSIPGSRLDAGEEDCSMAFVFEIPISFMSSMTFELLLLCESDWRSISVS